MTDFLLNDLQRAVISGLRRKDKIIAARCGWGSGKTTSLIFALWFVAKTRPGTTIAPHHRHDAALQLGAHA
jgi:hypothetical protein